MKDSLPEINKEPLSDFSLEDIFPFEKTNPLVWHDGPIESHWIHKNGDDYICTFIDVNSREEEHHIEWELIFRIEPSNFLDFVEGKMGFLDLIKMSNSEMFLQQWHNGDESESEKVWSLTFKELEDIYDGDIPLGNKPNKVHRYDDYFEDEMKPYLQNKIRNSKINSLKL